MKEAIDVSQLTVNYGKIPVLWNLSFSIPQGKIVGIIGPNGAGKSTLLKALLGVVKPLAGKVSFFGSPLKKVLKKIAYVPQRSSVDWYFPITALDLVSMGRYCKLGPLKWKRAADKKAALRALEMVGMLAFADRQIGELSGGQQQRLFIARALLQDADIYMMDEPFAGVDMATEKAILLLLEELKSKGKTLLIVHHDLNTVEDYFDWVLLLNTSLVGIGPTKKVFTNEAIRRTYGGQALLDEAARLAEKATKGLL